MLVLIALASIASKNRDWSWKIQLLKANCLVWSLTRWGTLPALYKDNNKSVRNERAGCVIWLSPLRWEDRDLCFLKTEVLKGFFGFKRGQICNREHRSCPLNHWWEETLTWSSYQYGKRVRKTHGSNCARAEVGERRVFSSIIWFCTVPSSHSKQATVNFQLFLHMALPWTSQWSCQLN